MQANWCKLYVNIFSHPWPIIWVTLHCLLILRTSGFFQPWGLFYFLFQFVPGEVCMFPRFQRCGQPINQATSIHGRPSKQFVHYFQPAIPCCRVYERFPFTKKFRKCRSGCKWNTTFWFAPLEIFRNKRNFWKASRVFPMEISQWKICVPFNQLTSVFHASVLLLIMNFVITLSK